MKIATVIGARPQFIKAAAVSREMARRHGLREVLVHTGQHFDADMSDIFFDELEIRRPDYNLGVGGGSHGAMTGRQLEAVESVLLEERPDWVLVYGDTNSTLAGALAAAKLQIPVAHVEAGLRSFNRQMPEEVNRVLTDHVATLLFPPTTTARKNLLREGIDERAIRLAGDVMYDAALFYRSRARKPDWFDALAIDARGFVLAIVHRAENTDDPERLSAIMKGLAESALPVVLPLHPRTRHRLAALELSLPERIALVAPVGYLEMVWLEAHCAVVATDSGGVQKEAYFHGKPCVTLRDETEWVELVEAGCNVLVGADSAMIAAALTAANNPTPDTNPYGQGRAAREVIWGLGG